jgi:2-hydroxychromene-2-carboxylate isomerase
MSVVFQFDYACPYAYLASQRVEALCARVNASLELKPVLLGGIFRALEVPQLLFATLSPAKARHNLQDMHRLAALWGIPLAMHPQHPVRTVEALRATLSVPAGQRSAVMHRLYRAYWVEHLDLADRAVLVALLDEAGVSGEEHAGPFCDDIKGALRSNTDQAIAGGAFGVPALHVDGDLYWGADRMFMVESRLGGAPPALPVGTVDEPTTVDFHFDFSSPFAYLGSTQIEAVCADHGATLRWRPMLLGGVFKMLGGPNVPLATFPQPKQRYIATDLERWAECWEVPYAFPSRFPMKTTAPLRIALALGDAMPAFVHAVFRAYWADDRDISDLDVLAGLLTDVGADPSLASAADDLQWKTALIEATQEAVDAGVFGAPTTRVKGELFWGQDRLGMVREVLAGWSPPTLAS